MVASASASAAASTAATVYAHSEPQSQQTSPTIRPASPGSDEASNPQEALGSQQHMLTGALLDMGSCGRPPLEDLPGSNHGQLDVLSRMAVQIAASH